MELGGGVRGFHQRVAATGEIVACLANGGADRGDTGAAFERCGFVSGYAVNPNSRRNAASDASICDWLLPIAPSRRA